MEPKKFTVCWVLFWFGLKAKRKHLKFPNQNVRSLETTTLILKRSKQKYIHFSFLAETLGGRENCCPQIGDTDSWIWKSQFNQSSSPGGKSSAGTSTRMGTLKLYLMKLCEPQCRQIWEWNPVRRSQSKCFPFPNSTHTFVNIFTPRALPGSHSKDLRKISSYFMFPLLSVRGRHSLFWNTLEYLVFLTIMVSWEIIFPEPYTLEFYQSLTDLKVREIHNSSSF